MPLPVCAEIPEVSESPELKSILAEDGESVLWENGDDGSVSKDFVSGSSVAKIFWLGNPTATVSKNWIR